VKSLLISIGVIYVAIAALMWSLQSSLVYPRGMRDHVGTPADVGLQWESVTLETEDGLILDAWWVPADQPRAHMLFLHGNAGNISHRLRSLQQFNRLNLSVLIIDYRGYGRSQGRPDEPGTALDARAAWQWLLQNNPQADRVIFGRSLGAAVAAELARSADAEAVILESAFRSITLLGQQLYPFLPVRLLARLHYPVIDYVRDINSPLLVVHSEDDEIIPFTEGMAVYEAANEPKQLLVIRGGHNNGFVVSEREYLAGIDTFLNQALTTPFRNPHGARFAGRPLHAFERLP
jgi:uncharacterized protein